MGLRNIWKILWNIPPVAGTQRNSEVEWEKLIYPESLLPKWEAKTKSRNEHLTRVQSYRQFIVVYWGSKRRLGFSLEVIGMTISINLVVYLNGDGRIRTARRLRRIVWCIKTTFLGTMSATTTDDDLLVNRRDVLVVVGSFSSSPFLGPNGCLLV